MASINVDTIRSLAVREPTAAPVVTVYLDVDGRRWPRFAECEARLERMVKDVSGDGALPSTVAADLDRIVGHVKAGVDRSRTRGLAFFASGPQLWEVFDLPVRVRDQVVVNDTPHLTQLEAVVENHTRFGVLLADRQRARMFVFELGELVDKSELFEALPRHEDDAGGADRRHDRSHVDAAAHQHLKHAAQVAFEVFKAAPFDHLVLGAPDEIRRELEGVLHTYLRERLAGYIDIVPGAPDAEVRAAALDVEARIEREKEAATVERLRAAAAVGKGAVAGLDATLKALAERRVATLVVSDGYEAPGWRCAACGRLATKGRSCPDCGAEMTLLDDIVEAAIEETLRQHGHVDVCVDNADLDVLGRVGALTRF